MSRGAMESSFDGRTFFLRIRACYRGERELRGGRRRLAARERVRFRFIDRKIASVCVQQSSLS